MGACSQNNGTPRNVARFPCLCSKSASLVCHIASNLPNSCKLIYRLRRHSPTLCTAVMSAGSGSASDLEDNMTDSDRCLRPSLSLNLWNLNLTFVSWEIFLSSHSNSALIKCSFAPPDTTFIFHSNPVGNLLFYKTTIMSSEALQKLREKPASDRFAKPINLVLLLITVSTA